MTEITVITNNVPRDVIEAYELTPKEQAEFDYLDWDKIKAGEDNTTFFRYKGELYDLGEFMSTQVTTTPAEFVIQFRHWDGIQTESFFSGILVKYVDDYEHVIVARYYT